VLRGGAWNNQPHNVACAIRNHNEPDDRNNNIGFRVAKTPCGKANGKRQTLARPVFPEYFVVAPSGVHSLSYFAVAKIASLFYSFQYPTIGS
jgi:hypothetical protein